MRVCAFVGPSGTGKSYRAQMVAGENDIEFIIDDGLLVKGNAVVAGTSAKKAPTKVETVKHALFYEENEKREMQEAFERYKPEAILILGTSDGMVAKIAANLGLPQISKTVYINDVATEEEMENARRIRVTEGKHVIPVPTFEIKKDFSGYLLDPLQIFKSTGKGKSPYIAEKSIIRPTFSYMGNFTISDNVFKQIIEHLANKEPSIYKVTRTRVNKGEQGTEIYMEVIVNYGKKIVDILHDFQVRSKKEIERLTAMNVAKIDVMAKGINIPKDMQL
ncbi:MAG: Asp23/Gls24 family envelope stress response protein [Clostridia bacterium]|nr:Asp23/Gls24 family envelope stress response protein [Clostridia bacterium]